MINRREFLRKSVAAGVAAAAGPAWLWAAAQSGPAGGGNGAKKPNFVVIFCDDLGYGDLACFGSATIRTPALDRMAKEGTRFTDFYVAAPVCSASRTALLTGRYGWRAGIPGVLFPGSTNGLAASEPTIGSVLKASGYATACVGKWHVGFQKQFLPARHGFDSYFGIPYSNDMTIAKGMTIAKDVVLREGATLADARAGKAVKHHVPLMRDEEVVEYPADQSTLTQRYTQEALRFIAANKDKPFFLYLAHTMPHIPLAVSADFKGRSKAGLYADVIEELDWSTGQILDALRAAGLAQNTIVLFTSDNGPWLIQRAHGGSAGPLREGKGTTYEGGLRVPTIAWGPGLVPAGQTSAEMASTLDLLPTFAALAGATIPSTRPLDGLDVSAVLTRPGAKSPRDTYYYYSGPACQAVRVGRWKYRHPGPKAAPELYDLQADIGEKNNLASATPEKVKELSALLSARQGEVSTKPAKARKDK